VFITTRKPPSAIPAVAAARAVEMVQDGMRVGLGTGSTAAYAVKGLGARVRVIYADTDQMGVVYHGTHARYLETARVEFMRDADRLSFAEIEKQIEAHSQRATEGALSIADLTGGTFTITNGGVFGSLMSTPILNPPQVGILGMHKIQERPIARDGQVLIQPMMYVALSYDHRIVDGREAVQFLVRIKEQLEDPEILLFEG